MLEEFQEFKRYHTQKLRDAAEAEAHEAELHKLWETSLPPDRLEKAKRYDEITRKVGSLILREVLREFFPVSKDLLRNALDQGDYDLESIPAELWLSAAEQIPYLPGRELDIDQKVEALKHFVRWHYGV